MFPRVEVEDRRRALLERPDAPWRSGRALDLACVRNPDFRPAASPAAGAYDFITASRWCIECVLDPATETDREPFEAAVVALVTSLRASAMIVTASCDFEARIERETGWNWRADAPQPPE